MREGLQEIHENTQWLVRLLSMSPEQRVALDRARLQQGELTTHADDVRRALTTVMEQAESMIQLLDQFEAAPIIYTGQGSTAEVLAKLEHLISLGRKAGVDL